MAHYELVCFSLKPGLSPEQAHAAATAVLPDAPPPRPGERLAILPLEQARIAQQRLTAAGVVCNYRPATTTPDWRLADEEHILRCPRCGETATVPRQRRNYRCRRCHHAVLRHGREIPPPSRQPAPRSAATGGSHMVTGLLVLALAVMLAGPVQPAAPTGPLRAAWHRATLPLAREFHFLTQVMALKRQRSTSVIAATAATTVQVAPPAVPTPSQPTPAIPPMPPGKSSTSPAPPPAPVPTDLPRLPHEVREARTLNQLHQALTRQAAAANAPTAALPPLPEPPALPPVPLRLPYPAVPVARLQAAVTALDDHLRRTAPFLRRLYAHELTTLAQLRQLERTFAGPSRDTRLPSPSDAPEAPPDAEHGTAAPVACPVARPVVHFCPLSG